MLKPILASKSSPQQSGQRAEVKARDFFRQQGFEILFENLKTPFAEVDLILFKDATYFLVEVKTAPAEYFEAFRVSHSQQRRLIRAFHWLSRRHHPLRSALVWVYPQGEPRVFFDFLTS